MVVAKQKQAAGVKPRGKGVRKQAGSRGMAKVTAEADKKVELNSEKIVQSLVDSALKGNISGARLLFSLAEGQTDSEAEGGMRAVRSFASELALEPEWDGGGIKASAETSLGQAAPAV
jgi:hypothetical protein